MLHLIGNVGSKVVHFSTCLFTNQFAALLDSQPLELEHVNVSSTSQ